MLVGGIVAGGPVGWMSVFTLVWLLEVEGVDFSRIVILFSNDVIVVYMPLINFSNSLKQQEGQRKGFSESLMDSNTIFGSPAHLLWIQESHAPSQKIKSTPELSSDGVGISSKQIVHENTHLP